MSDSSDYEHQYNTFNDEDTDPQKNPDDASKPAAKPALDEFKVPDSSASDEKKPIVKPDEAKVEKGLEVTRYQEEAKAAIERGAVMAIGYIERQAKLSDEVEALTVEEVKTMKWIATAMKHLQQTSAKKTVTMAEKRGVEAGMTYIKGWHTGNEKAKEDA